MLENGCAWKGKYEKLLIHCKNDCRYFKKCLTENVENNINIENEKICKDQGSVLKEGEEEFMEEKIDVKNKKRKVKKITGAKKKTTNQTQVNSSIRL